MTIKNTITSFLRWNNHVLQETFFRLKNNDIVANSLADALIKAMTYSTFYFILHRLRIL